MPPTEQTTAETSPGVRAADVIKAAMSFRDDAEAADMIDGQLLVCQAHRDPALYLAVAEAFFEARRVLPVMRSWGLFTECLKDHAQDFAGDPAAYAAAVVTLQGFVGMFQSDPEFFAGVEVFSATVNAAIDDFDEATIGDRPAERFRNDRLLNGDSALEYGDERAAARLYRQAAEEDGKPEGWLRLLQLMAEADLGEGFGLAAALDACEKATAAGIWHARAYVLQRLISAEDRESAAGIVPGDRRLEMSRHTRAFLSGWEAYTAGRQTASGSGADAPEDVFSRETPQEVLAALSLAAANNGVKSAVGAFLPAVAFMRRCGWISPEDISALPAVLDAFDALLAEESAQAAAAMVRPAEGAFSAEEQAYYDMAIQLNAGISEIIGEMRLFLSESV